MRARLSLIPTGASLVVAAVLALLLSGLARARELPIEQFFRKPEYLGVTVSPDGRTLAALAPNRGRHNLLVVDLASRRARVLTSFEDYDVVSFWWANNDRLLFTLGNLAEPASDPRQGGLFAINKDGSEPRTFAPTVKQQIERGQIVFRNVIPASRIPGSDREYFVFANERHAKNFDVYRMDVYTGKRTLATFDSPGNVVVWVGDHAGVVRAAMSASEGRRAVWYRPSEKAPWRRIAEFSFRQYVDPGSNAEAFIPWAFDYDNRTLFVIAHRGRDKAGIHAYDPETGTFKDAIYTSDVADVGDDFALSHGLSGVVFDEKKRRAVGVAFVADRRGTYWIDEEWKSIQAAIDRALPGSFNLVRRIGRTDRAMVIRASDVQPPVWYIYDIEKRTLEELARSREWIKSSEMSEKKFVTFRARDGLTIPAYLTVPVGSTGRNLPLVIHPHGGPWARDYWGWDPEVQFLANRGYAVLQPQFRISTGFGRQLFNAGFREWGGRMQDDITDAVQWAVDQGIADRNRVCIYGASYGGYAALMGLIKTPELFRCGINYVGVTDLNLLFTRSFFSRDFVDFEMREMLGDPQRDRELLRRNSPVENADRIRAPVLMAYGGDDLNVPLDHGLDMKRALERAGKPFEWIVKETEGHGFARFENQLEFYGAMERFLKRYLQ